MTAPQAKATSTTRKAAAKKTTATVTPIDTAKGTDADAPAKADVEAAPAQRAPRTVNKVGPLPKPVTLAWAEKDGKHVAQSGRYRYRITEGADGGWFAATATGKWVPLLGRCETLDEAKQVCEIDAAGAHWMAWTKFNGVALATLIEEHGWAK